MTGADMEKFVGEISASRRSIRKRNAAVELNGVISSDVIWDSPCKNGELRFDTLPPGSKEFCVVSHNFDFSSDSLEGLELETEDDVDKAEQLVDAILEHDGDTGVHVVSWEDKASAIRARSIAFEASKQCMLEATFERGVYRIGSGDEDPVKEPGKRM